MSSCSICSAPGTNKSTCPFNPDIPVSAHKPQKHATKATAAAEKPAVAVTIKPKPVSPKAAAAPLKSLVPPLAFPGNPAKQKEFEADWIRLQLPPVPRTYEPISSELTETCGLCHKLINWKPLTPADQTKRWLNINSVCEKCANLVGAQYNKDTKSLNQSRYKKYHKAANPSVDEINTHAAKDSYYNSTMYDAARFWSGIAIERALPSVPK